MSWFLYGEDEAVKNWIIERVDCLHKLDPCVTIGVVSNDKLIAGIAYHDYHMHFRLIQMSMAAITPMWAKKDIIKRLLQYPFEQLDCFKVMAVVEPENSKALKTLNSIGFRQEVIMRHMFGEGKHAVVMEMLKPDYNRIFGANNGKEKFSRSTTTSANRSRRNSSCTIQIRKESGSLQQAVS